MRPVLSLEQVRTTLSRLFIDAAGTSLRKEDEQKSRELWGLLTRLAGIKQGAHLVEQLAENGQPDLGGQGPALRQDRLQGTRGRGSGEYLGHVRIPFERAW